jgi:transposase
MGSGRGELPPAPFISKRKIIKAGKMEIYSRKVHKDLLEVVIGWGKSVDENLVEVGRYRWEGHKFYIVGMEKGMGKGWLWLTVSKVAPGRTNYGEMKSVFGQVIGEYREEGKSAEEGIIVRSKKLEGEGGKRGMRERGKRGDFMGTGMTVPAIARMYKSGITRILDIREKYEKNGEVGDFMEYVRNCIENGRGSHYCETGMSARELGEQLGYSMDEIYKWGSAWRKEKQGSFIEYLRGKKRRGKREKQK